MCDVNPSIQSMRIKKTYSESVCRLARLLALCKRPQIEDLIARLTDAELMGETLSDLPAGLVSGPFFARIFFMYETVRMQKSGVTQGR